MKSGFHSHEPRTWGPLGAGAAAGASRLTARWRGVESSPEPAIEEEAPELVEGALNKVRRLKGEPPKQHIGLRLSADVVESVRASGRGYNVRVEEALRAAGFGAKASAAKKPAKKSA